MLYLSFVMGLVSSVLSYIGHLAIIVISAIGYPGILVLMALESMIFPIPSELVMPFAGFLAGKGEMNFWLVVLFSSLGSLIGSLVSYYMGYYGGRHFVSKFGKYFLLDETDLAKAESWFKKSGEKTIFISRFIPVVRHIISIPAGMGRMDIKKFCVYTVAGATLWNAFLAYLGYFLGERWELVRHYSESFSIIVAVILLAAFVVLVYRHTANRRLRSLEKKT